MSPTYFALTVTVFTKSLENLKHFLQKGLEHAEVNGVAESDFLAFKLAPDMFPLSRQIQIVTDNAKGAVARLASVEPLKIEDTESTAVELINRIDTVIAHIGTFTPEQFTAAGEGTVTLPYYPGKYMKAPDYLTEFALPNFFFHLNMAYAIIRSSGVALGKGDYLGTLTMHDVV